MHIASYLFIYYCYYGESMKQQSFTKYANLVPLLKPGESVTVEDEVVVVNSTVLPHKTLNVGVQDEILL